MQTAYTAPQDNNNTRLYYLDWLRVLAVLGVFLFHAVHPFDLTDWHIKNAEQSTAITAVLAFMFPWGMPFFFLLSGAGSWFALRRRTARQFVGERTRRLLLPYIGGALLLMPLMLYFEWLHKTQIGIFTMSFREYLLDRNVGFTPVWFGALGYHLWFLGFLYAFSLLGLPLCLWLRGGQGQRLLARLAGFCQWRGAILLFFLPLALLRLGLQPFFPREHSWADFAVQMAFYLAGFVLFSHPGFLQALRRDRWICLAVGVAAAVVGMGLAFSAGSFDLEQPPETWRDQVFWLLVVLDGWCWSLVILYVGMRFLNFSNPYLQYGQEAILPFFVFHQPVIIVLAYYAVQWPASLGAKLAFVVVGSFTVTLGIYELLIRRFDPLRRLFGMKPRLQASPVQAGV